MSKNYSNRALAPEEVVQLSETQIKDINQILDNELISLGGETFNSGLETNMSNHPVLNGLRIQIPKNNLIVEKNSPMQFASHNDIKFLN